MSYDPEYHRQYYQANKEKKREQNKKWEAANIEKVREAGRKRAAESRKKDPEKQRQRTYAYEKANPEKILLRSAKNRAIKNNLEFDIELCDIIVPKYCPLLNIEIKPREGGHGPQDSSPSLDRIDNTKGYIKGNVWVISWLANKMKATATAAQLLIFAENVQKLLGKSPKPDTTE